MDTPVTVNRRYDRPDFDVDRFDPDPTRSFTLAANYYVDPDVLEAEKTTIFHRSWLQVGHVCELAEPGNYITAEIVGQRVFVIRQASGELRAFFNVCLHRGHTLLEGSGTIGSSIACPYHAWAYDEGGQLVGARMANRMEAFDFDDYHLPEVAVEVFCGFVFVNLDPEPTPMAELYPGAEAEARRIHPEPERLKPVFTSTFTIGGNWKNVGDNLLECYHCHPAHRTFVDLIDMGTYRNETNENWSIQAGSANPDNGVYDIGDGFDGFTSLFLWPNVSLGTLPGQRGMFVFHFTPTGPEETLQTLTYYGPDEERTPSEAASFDFFDNILGPEDVDLVENVQVGLRSIAYHQGRFICIPDRPEISEHAVHHFHTMVLSALNGG